jgi:hypothetical protein
MRILHIIGTLNPAAGGPTESVRVLLSYGPIGYTGEVVTLDDPKSPYLQNIGFPVHALGPTRTTYGFNRKLMAWLKANRDRGSIADMRRGERWRVILPMSCLRMACWIRTSNMRFR